MSIFSRKRNLRRVISSVASSVILSSCTSQVAQCWPHHVAFDPDKNEIVLCCASLRRDQLLDAFRVFTVNKNSVISFKRLADKASLYDYFPFCSKKQQDVDKLVDLLFKYYGDCNKLYNALQELDNFKRPHDMCLLRSSGHFWTNGGFFDLLNLKSDAAKKVYSSLKPEYRELVDSLRKQSDKIVKLYSSLNYRIHGIHINIKNGHLWITTDNKSKAENIALGWPHYFGVVESREILHDEAIINDIANSIHLSDRMQTELLLCYDKVFRNYESLFRKIEPVDENDEPVDESCEREDDWDWSWPKSGELIELDRGDRYTCTDLRMDPDFFLYN